MFDYTICNCKKVTFFDVEDALNKFDKFQDLEKTLRKFRKSPTVQRVVAAVTVKSSTPYQRL